jgi:hypothetical protein
MDIKVEMRDADLEKSASATTTRIWIEPVKRPDGRNWYTERLGLLLRTRLGGPDGEILCDRVHNPICESCRILMARGILDQFETLKPGIPYPCMIGDIASVAGLTVHESDDGVVHFAKWTPFDQDAVSRSVGLAPARESVGAAMGTTCQHERLPTAGRQVNSGGC